MNPSEQTPSSVDYASTTADEESLSSTIAYVGLKLLGVYFMCCAIIDWGYVLTRYWTDDQSLSSNFSYLDGTYTDSVLWTFRNLWLRDCGLGDDCCFRTQ